MAFDKAMEQFGEWMDIIVPGAGACEPVSLLDLSIDGEQGRLAGGGGGG